MDAGRRQGRLLIHGASGFTGRLIGQEAARRGWRPILAGRSAARLEAVAAGLGCEARLLPLGCAERLDAGLQDVGLVLNVASPFLTTAPPLIEACLRTGAHYLDVGGDLRVFEHAHTLGRDAEQAGVMLMPGVGFIVAASDCLAAHVSARLPLACSLEIGVSRPTLWSRGSMQTLMDLWSDEVVVRRDGRRAVAPIGSIYRAFDFGWGERLAAAMGWPDALSAYLTTGIPDITVYGEVDAADRILLQSTRWLGRAMDTRAWRSVMKRQWSLLPDGPGEQARAGHRRVLVAEATDAGGRRERARLRTPDPYTLTTDVALNVVERALEGEILAGHRTPARVYGAGLVLDMPAVELESLEGGDWPPADERAEPDPAP